MSRFLIEALLQVSILIPFAVFLVKGKTKENYLRIFFFALVYVLYQLVLVLPRLVPALNLVEGRWNWDGKIFGILFGLGCYFALRKYFRGHDFFTLRQDQDNIKKTVAVAVAAIVLVTLVAYLTGSSEFSAETLAFQLTMPGLDEELMFRVVLLGLLAEALRDRIAYLGNPAVLLTAVLFGLLHALSLDKSYALGFEPVYFLHTAFGGLIFGWLTVKSRSFLLALLVHGLANFFAALATMMK
jgi:membrane protease YdiL (CAAX protease family)